MTLAPHLKWALDHPVRRRMLRALNDDGKAQTLEELTTLIPGTNISTIGYHALALEECGTVSVTVSLAEPATGQAGNRYASNIGDDQAVRQVLSQTRECDESSE